MNVNGKMCMNGNGNPFIFRSLARSSFLLIVANYHWYKKVFFWRKTCFERKKHFMVNAVHDKRSKRNKVVLKSYERFGDSELIAAVIVYY